MKNKKETKTEKSNKNGKATKRTKGYKITENLAPKMESKEMVQQTGKFGIICYFICKKQTIFWKMYLIPCLSSTSQKQ